MWFVWPIPISAFVALFNDRLWGVETVSLIFFTSTLYWLNPTKTWPRGAPQNTCSLYVRIYESLCVKLNASKRACKTLIAASTDPVHDNVLLL